MQLYELQYQDEQKQVTLIHNGKRELALSYFYYLLNSKALKGGESIIQIKIPNDQTQKTTFRIYHNEISTQGLFLISESKKIKCITVENQNSNLWIERYEVTPVGICKYIQQNNGNEVLESICFDQPMNLLEYGRQNVEEAKQIKKYIL